MEIESVGLQLEIESLPTTLNNDEPHVVCEVNPRLFHQCQGYRMTVTETKVINFPEGKTKLLYQTSSPKYLKLR